MKKSRRYWKKQGRRVLRFKLQLCARQVDRGFCMSMQGDFANWKEARALLDYYRTLQKFPQDIYIHPGVITSGFGRDLQELENIHDRDAYQK